MDRKGPHPPGKTRWALGVTASITSPLTNEQFTEMAHLKGERSVVLAVNLDTNQFGRGEAMEFFKKERDKRRKSELLLCLQIRVRLKYGI